MDGERLGSREADQRLSAFDPAFSPDGSKIVYVANRMLPGANFSIFTINRDGSGATELGPGAGGPAYSSDGSTIVHTRLTLPSLVRC